MLPRWPVNAPEFPPGAAGNRRPKGPGRRRAAAGNLLIRLEAAAAACRTEQTGCAGHARLFRRFLEVNLEEKAAQVRGWLAGEPPERVRSLLRDPKGEESRGRFLALAPGCAPAAERDCFAADLAAALEVVAARGAHGFSARERELLVLLAQGLSSKQIAARLGLSVHTVSNHRRRIREKTGVSGAALVAWAAKSGAGSEND